MIGDGERKRTGHSGQRTADIGDRRSTDPVENTGERENDCHFKMFLSSPETRVRDVKSRNARS